jgi:hypothetical protein
MLLPLLVVDVLHYNHTFELVWQAIAYQALLVTTQFCDTTVLVRVAFLRDA